MRIQLWSVGKPHDTLVKPGVEEFTKRLNKYFSAEWVIISPPKNAASMDEKTLKKEEAKLIERQLHQDDLLVLLDERGKQLSSPDLAQFIQQKANESNKRLVFLIGGAFGVDAALLPRAQFTWSLSKLVFPHMLVRYILAEQLYRACTILRNDKYHHV